MSTSETRKPPVTKFGPVGTGGGLVEVAVWENDSETGSFYTVSIQRSYQVDEEWRRTGTLTKHDLLPLAQLLQQAWSWISAQQARNRKEE